MQETKEQGNREQNLAADFVEQTACNIFLTGKAGTGKTTFLKKLHTMTAKRFIVTAPTGVAAINAGGVTLHSFFQLPFGPYLPGQDLFARGNKRRFRFGKEKRAIIASLDLLVIDEISMVRADLLDSVDAVLRHFRRSDEPFGGVQLLMIGDLFQLPPVIKQEERRLLDQQYDSFYFFSSQALKQTEFITIELQHIYRQSDPEFIRILNQVRQGRLDAAAQNALDLRCLSDCRSAEEEGSITLTTHNLSAESINQQQLERLNGKNSSLEAQISGDFPEQNYPAPHSLGLKIGAQVMFVKNDPSYEKEYYNGKIGRVMQIVPGRVTVSCPGDDKEIIVEPVTWENIKYTLNPESKEIEEEIVGTFRQFPLKLAWAITIHKSQGLTFEKAIIDAQAAFAHGQTYVALSRCRSLDGLVLRTKLSSQAVSTDQVVVNFTRTASQNPPNEAMLKAFQITYQQNLLLGCFTMNRLQQGFHSLYRQLKGNWRSIHVPLNLDDLDTLWAKAEETIFRVSESFCRQLQTLFKPDSLPEFDPMVLERLRKASQWFCEKMRLFLKPCTLLELESDNQAVVKRLNRARDDFRSQYAVVFAGIETLARGFQPAEYLQARVRAELSDFEKPGAKSAAPTYTESDITHPELFDELKRWRTATAKAQNIAPYQVLHQRVLIQIVVCLPNTLKELQMIQGIGPKTAEKYGTKLVEIVAAYRQEKNIQTVEMPEPKELVQTAKKGGSKSRTGTKEVSLALFETGRTIEEIAVERGLARSTIEGHLCAFVEEGTLALDELLSSEEQNAITKALDDLTTDSLGEVKKHLADAYTYGQIKMVIAYKNYCSSIKN